MARNLTNQAGSILGLMNWVPVLECVLAGLVPFFCPNWFARLMKFIEPMGERVPIIKNLVCAVYAFVAIRGIDGVQH